MGKNIVIIGSGVVGQTTGSGLKEHGHSITYVDIDERLTENLESQGETVMTPEKMDGIRADIVMFCVSTPESPDGSVNLEHMTDAITAYGPHLRSIVTGNERPLVVIRSTVPPGTTKQLLIPLLEQSSGLSAGKDFGVCVQPEFLRERSSREDFLHPRAIVIGQLDKLSGDRLAGLYEDFGSDIFRVDLRTAEFIKYAHNLVNAAKISFANEMWRLGERIGIDTNEALSIVSRTAEACWNPDYGLRGGYPYSGSCLPKDTKGFHEFASRLGIEMPLLAAVIRTNEMIENVTERRDIVPEKTDCPSEAAKVAGGNPGCLS